MKNKSTTTSQLSERCFRLLEQVPAGRVTTYKELCLALNTRGYRAIGQILNKNRNIPVIPCHRVVKSTGEIGGYRLGKEKKIALLLGEKVSICDGYIENFAERLFRAADFQSSS